MSRLGCFRDVADTKRRIAIALPEAALDHATANDIA